MTYFLQTTLNGLNFSDMKSSKYFLTKPLFNKINWTFKIVRETMSHFWQFNTVLPEDDLEI